MARLAGVHLSLLAHILQTVLPSLIHPSELALFGSADEMIQVFCRWRSPTSVAEYRQTALPSLIHRSYSRTPSTALHTLYAHVALFAWGVSFASRFEHRPRSLFSFFFRSI